MCSCDRVAITSGVGGRDQGELVRASKSEVVVSVRSSASYAASGGRADRVVGAVAELADGGRRSRVARGVVRVRPGL